MSSGAIGTAPDSDEALLAAIQRRDQRAEIAALYDRYGGLAFGLAYRILGERSVAEDAYKTLL